ncbi:MAG: 1-deoxy-D-xylulose-5-phosphate reductoisomerase, partial [Verrucomicrobia bacterium]|nr:1-deoxy-D-xylulose-5-phosphate reductoisomerase [Verrucomicrobiota bacterium]
MRKRQVILLGATGSIGASAIKVAETVPDRMEIVGLAANQSAEQLAELANRLRPKGICLVDPARQHQLKSALHYSPEIFLGEDGLTSLATLPGSDLVLVAIVGTGGLRPSLAALSCGKDLAVASKEILVMAGGIVMSSAHRHGAHVLPVDSEHSAIFQCLEGRSPEEIKSLILTASGGPFRTLPEQELANVSKAQALNHPTWKMGQKITIDSATLFNKGLEMIEACWLFNVPIKKVRVIIHPQSIVHSLVEFVDGSMLAQLGPSDMCIPIQSAVTWPDRVPGRRKSLNLAEVAKLEFEEPRYKAFPALDLARQAGQSGGVMPAVLNAANEIAVQAFLDDRIFFSQIWQLVDRALQNCENLATPLLDDILEADKLAR